MPVEFREPVQHDASEFIRKLFEELGGYEGELLRDVFAGVVTQKVKCLSCGGISARRERVCDFSFYVPEEAVSLLSVQDFFDTYSAVDRLEGENGYNCGVCGLKRDAVVWNEIYSPPCHVMVTLNRFAYKSGGQKVTTPVRINKTVRIWGEIYQLYAVIFHVGRSLDSGHYYCIARNSEGRGSFFEDYKIRTKNNKSDWKLFNDAVVQPSNYKTIKSLSTRNDRNAANAHTPYIAFYRCLKAPLTQPPKALRYAKLKIPT